MHIVKQKLGTLRVQSLHGYSEAMRALAEETYERSMEICELCGAPAKYDSERKFAGCVETLCDTCRIEHRPQHATGMNEYCIEYDTGWRTGSVILLTVNH